MLIIGFEGKSDGAFLQVGGVRFAWNGVGGKNATVLEVQILDRFEQRFM